MDIEITKLPNGLTVVSDPMPGLQSVAVGIWVDCGARHETRAIMGVSHMLEHMAFKGTEKRTAKSLAEEIEAVGGFLNAYTSRETTAFHARVLKPDLALAVDILADILSHPTFDQAELERERQVVLQELGQARDTPDDIIFDHLQEALYPGQPMGFPILGDEQTVSNFSREDLQRYMGANYRTGGMTLIASGAVNHAELVALAAEKSAGFRPGAGPTAEAARYGGGEKRQDDDLEQVHLAYAFPGVSQADPDYYAAQVYAAALGGGMSSRLFQEAREKRGLCYTISAFSQSFQDGGAIGVYTGTGETEAGEISAVIAGEMASLAATANEAEVSRARAQLRSGLLMGLERPSARTEQISASLSAHGRVVSVEEMLAKLEAVDAAVVRRFGERVMATTHPALAAVGPLGKLESYETFAARFGTMRRAAE
ncbi:MAG TPA: pitrilysin family protein [Rhizomicrobium sp.]|jgi:predicted Zn-dependent peptidase